MATLVIPKKPGTPFPESAAYTNAPAAHLVVSAIPAVMVGLVVTNLSANARFVQIHNAAALPNNGTAPLVSLPLPASGAIALDTAIGGPAGLVVAISDNDDTLTISSDEALIYANLQES